ncbi:hypothetical protein [Herbaspirillum rubrisubalbicans]|uniref:hypothetical protein n=1 Tax=Herbaspirillum rubrisubalbicans TaxID=80842 RepID=UPI0015C55136|nr:hypothetical protein [Herbaspirillum rubrisubalbicans]NQE47512.1 hypothetical protein [Herbaspirillum rubrisubalbicans]
MALTVTEIEELRSYLNGVMNRADHHAGAVNEIALALAGAILWRKNDDEPIKVMVRDGQTTNVLWVRIGEKRYAFSYNHDAAQIEMREGSTHGQTLHTFTNATSLASIRTIFQSL